MNCVERNNMFLLFEVMNEVIALRYGGDFYKLKLGVEVMNDTLPFPFLSGFNVETVEYKNISFTVWDVGGQDKVCSIAKQICVFEYLLEVYAKYCSNYWLKVLHVYTSLDCLMIFILMPIKHVKHHFGYLSR